MNCPASKRIAILLDPTKIWIFMLFFHNIGVRNLTSAHKKGTYRGWRDGSEIKGTGCSSRGPQFNSQQPHGGLQPPVMRSGVLFWPAVQVYKQAEHCVHNN